MITFRRAFVSIADVFLDEEVEELGVDIVNYLHRLKPIPGLSWSERHCLLIDLRQDAPDLMAQIGAHARQQIRRAQQKDGVSCERLNTESTASLGEFCDAYNTFADQKGQPRIPLRRLTLLAKGGILEVTRAATPAGMPLAWHAYVCAAGRTRLMFSCSHFRNHHDSASRSLIGRANRLLHWHDMLEFKQKGFTLYDMGGWHHAGTDPELVRINQFKSEFGGYVAPSYSCKHPLTLKGRIFFQLWRLSRTWEALRKRAR